MFVCLNLAFRPLEFWIEPISAIVDEDAYIWMNVCLWLILLWISIDFAKMPNALHCSKNTSSCESMPKRETRKNYVCSKHVIGLKTLGKFCFVNERVFYLGFLFVCDNAYYMGNKNIPGGLECTVSCESSLCLKPCKVFCVGLLKCQTPAFGTRPFIIKKPCPIWKHLLWKHPEREPTQQGEKIFVSLFGCHIRTNVWHVYRWLHHMNTQYQRIVLENLSSIFITNQIMILGGPYHRMKEFLYTQLVIWVNTILVPCWI